MNISQIYEKEKEYSFLKLISETNNEGIIEKTFKEYKIKAYIDFQNYSPNNKRIEKIDTRDYMTGLIRVPLIAVDIHGNSDNIEIDEGDCLIFENRKFELIEVRKIYDELKHYYSFYLTDFIENIKFDKYKTELNTLFFKIFSGLGIEAVVYHSFFHNRYFEKIISPFLTYEITQDKNLNDYTTIGNYLDKQNSVEHRFKVKRHYKMNICLYDKGEVLNLDVILSKNKIINYIIDNLDYKMDGLKELEIQNLEYISESDTIINNKIMNQKIYSLEFTVDTFYNKELDYIERIKIRR